MKSWNDITHTLCLRDVGTEVVLRSATAQLNSLLLLDTRKIENESSHCGFEKRGICKNSDTMAPGLQNGCSNSVDQNDPRNYFRS